jgi:hypothetical protein
MLHHSSYRVCARLLLLALVSSLLSGAPSVVQGSSAPIIDNGTEGLQKNLQIALGPHQHCRAAELHGWHHADRRAGAGGIP